EWVKLEIFPLIDSFQLPVKTVLRTSVEHVAIQISTLINQKEQAQVLVTGGGAYHSFLTPRITEKPSTKLTLPAPTLPHFTETSPPASLRPFTLPHPPHPHLPPPPHPH